MAVEDAILPAVQRHVRRSARPRLRATALEQKPGERGQLGALWIALAVEELHAQGQLAPGATRGLHKSVRQPPGVAVRLREERFWPAAAVFGGAVLFNRGTDRPR